MKQSDKEKKPKYIQSYNKRLYQSDPDNPNGIILEDGTKIDFDPTPESTPTGKPEEEFKIRMILEMRFGDGSGEPNLQIQLATREILAELAQAKREERERIKEIIQGVYTDETEKGYHEDVELNKAHNASLDIVMARLSQLNPKEGKG